MENYCFFNGEIVPFEQAQVAPEDLGVVRGYGVFDFFRTYQGKPVTLAKNLVRFQNSAKILGLTIPHSAAELTETIHTLIKKNNYPESTLRLVLTGGVSPDAFTPVKPTFYILNRPYKELPQELYTQGVAMITFEHQRLFPEAKTLNYMMALKLLPQRNQAKALEVLYIYQGKVLECSVSNFFMFKNNTLITPDTDVLKGITRQTVLNLAKSVFSVEIRSIAVSELAEATECFITATNKKVLPVVAIDGKAIGSGTVGQNTQKLMQLFNDHMLDLAQKYQL